MPRLTALFPSELCSGDQAKVEDLGRIVVPSGGDHARHIAVLNAALSKCVDVRNEANEVRQSMPQLAISVGSGCRNHLESVVLIEFEIRKCPQILREAISQVFPEVGEIPWPEVFLEGFTPLSWYAL